MNENETDPRPADASSESSSPERGQSEEPTAAQPVVPPAAPQTPQWGPPAAAPQSGVPQSGAPVAPQSGPPQSGPPQSGPPQSGQPQSGPPQWQQPSPWQQHPGYQHPGYPQQPYGQPQQPQSPYAQQSAYAGTPGAWAPAGSTTQTQPQIGAAEGQAWGEGQTWVSDGQPAWAAPVDQQQRPRNTRGRKILIAGAAAVLIALGAGGVGAATALAFDDDSSSPAVQTGNSSVTKVVDRSSLASIASAVQDSVVSITTGSGEGSGVVLSKDGYIVTNNHVVATAQGDNVTVIFADGKKSSATIVGTDERTDLAVVKVSGLSDLKPATFGSSAKMQVGDTVLAIGSPLGLEGSVTAGIISAKDRTIQSSSEDEQQQSPFGGQSQQQSGSSTTMSGLLQTDAPINPGNSGGALVNTSGEVIGINSAIATQGGSSGNIGLGFAIPSDKAKQVAEDLMAGKKVSHPALGVSVADAENGGALVSQVTAGSAAAKAGLQQGDVITSADGKAIGDSDDLVAAVQGGSVGQQMSLEYTRDGAKKTVTVTLTESK
ncbi:trypsin-like peptidase domain-containing protein [Paractinoplanes atraurantiacus]|uniref:Putative serine protease PepD n=1 Tax=Paractinoplanes atraurantiacus TaxID=1036182 RepID=A0A285FCP4_9ACTN|nr:trypsin-like peptidase domain-containing protein [Actinoplanes atraurantiacus]SNY08096.1 putative serine protease PepD [Actinoplanes atraurantiacus]